MKYIPLTKGYVALVSDSDYATVCKYNWHVEVTRHTTYAATSLNHPRRTLRLHRLIMNAPKGVEVDHKNGNGLDNRRSNLRFATRAQNSHNSRNKRSVYKGVTRLARLKKHPWQARIMVKGRQLHLGYFKTAAQAAFAYDVIAKHEYGAFGRGNGLIK